MPTHTQLGWAPRATWSGSAAVTNPTSECAWHTERAPTVPIASTADVITAREHGRNIACLMGFSPVEQTLVAAVISEFSTNILRYATSGEIAVRAVRSGGRLGITITAADSGPGIADVARALTDGFSTIGALGLGLPGARRLMDEFEIDSRVGRGTVVKATKWSNAVVSSAA